MNADAHRVLRERLGGYVLGQLDDESATRIADHVADCAECAGEVAELSPVVPLLAAVHPDELRDAEPPPWLADKVWRRIATERRRDRLLSYRGWATGTAAALVAVLVGFLIGYAVRTSPEIPPAAQPTALPTLSPPPSPTPTGPRVEPIPVEVNPAGVSATLGVIDGPSGAELRLTVTGLEQGAVYRARVISDEGVWYYAGSFVGNGSRPVRCTLTSGVLRDAAQTFLVLGPNGETVLTAAL